MLKVAFGNLVKYFATPLVPADYLGLVRPLTLPHRARVEAVRDELPGVRTLVLRPGRGWTSHVAGQHVQIGVAIDGRVQTRTFTLSSAPGRVEITVKAQGKVSRALASTVEVGTMVALSAPKGEFVAGDRPLLLVTAGSGVTPALAMLRAGANAVHVHWSRGPAICEAELRALGTIVIDTTRDTRRVQDLRTLVPDWAEREVLACGPQAFLDAVPMPAKVEQFRPVLRHRGNGGLIRLGDRTITGDGATPILHAAEAAGLAPKHGCRMGICHTCDVTMVSGCVRDLRTGQTIDEPGARIQICVCAAAGDVEVSL